MKNKLHTLEMPQRVSTLEDSLESCGRSGTWRRSDCEEIAHQVVVFMRAVGSQVGRLGKAYGTLTTWAAIF